MVSYEKLFLLIVIVFSIICRALSYLIMKSHPATATDTFEGMDENFLMKYLLYLKAENAN